MRLVRWRCRVLSKYLELREFILSGIIVMVLRIRKRPMFDLIIKSESAGTHFHIFPSSTHQPIHPSKHPPCTINSPIHDTPFLTTPSLPPPFFASFLHSHFHPSIHSSIQSSSLYSPRLVILPPFLIIRKKR